MTPLADEDQPTRRVQRPVYFVSEVLRDAPRRYPEIQKLLYAVLIASRKLRHYFQAHKISVATTFPLGAVLRNRHATGRIAKWAAELAEFELEFIPRTTIKSQALADFVAEWTPTEERDEEGKQVGPWDSPQSTPVQFTEIPWDMAFDGSARQGVAGAGVVITSPTGEKIKYVFRILFEASNNAAEYEALIAGLRAARGLGVRELRARGDSQLVINQVNGVCGCHKAHLAAYLIEVKKLELGFEAIEYVFIPRDSNTEADELSVIASSRQPPPQGVFDKEIPAPSARPADPGTEGDHGVSPETLVATGIILPHAEDRTGTSGASSLAVGEAPGIIRGGKSSLPYAEDRAGTFGASCLATRGVQGTSSTWIDEIRSYLSGNILPDDDATAERIAR